MFFQSIYQMMSAGTDLNINIRRTDGKLSVAVMPRRTTLKDEAGQTIVPLILNGTPMELDGQFLQIITTPLQKAQGILTNLETFEQQVRLAATQGKAAGTANDKKTKEAREKQEKMEKLLKRAEEAFTAGRYSEATTCFRQAKVLADTDRQKQIEARIQEVQKESSQGCLFPETDTQPLPQQPPANGTANGNRPDGQMRMFTSQPPQQPVQQAIPQPVPQPQIVQPQPYHNIIREHRNHSQCTKDTAGIPQTAVRNKQRNSPKHTSASPADSTHRHNHGNSRNPFPCSRRQPSYRQPGKIRAGNTCHRHNRPQKRSLLTRTMKVTGNCCVKTRMRNT